MRTAVVLFMSCFSFVQGAHAQSLPVSPIGNSAQDFGGIRTFLRAPHVTDVATLKADIAVVGMPFDQGTSNRPGQRYGPRDIREASLIYAWAPEKGFYYIDTGQTVLKGKRWADLGDVDVVPSDPLRTSQNMTSAVAAILERGAFPVILGGDHSITFPAVRAYKLPSLTVVHFDAHLDSYGNGDPNVLSHGEWVQQVGKLPGVRFIQIGMRGIVNDAGGVTAAQKLGSTIITAERVHRDEKARPSLVQTDLDEMNCRWSNMARGSLLPLAFCIVLASACESPRTRVGSKPTAADLIARGQYLANGIARCFLCHSPLNDGDPALPRPETLGAGDVLDEKAPLIAPNITFERETGLGDWSDREIVRAIREGIGRDGRELQEHPANHYSVMTDEDVSAIIAYLRSLRPIRRPLPRSAPPLRKTEWVQRKSVPALSSALNSPRQRGAYLVQLGECIGCHTPARGDGSILRELEFAGGRRFRLEKGYGVDIGKFDPMLSSAEAPPPMTGRVVASANITPDPSGIPYYTEAIFIQTIRTGKVSGVRQLSAAMPWVFFRTLSDPDLRDIFAYLKTLRPTQHNVDNTDEPTFCRRCGHSHGLGELNVPLRMERR